MERRKHLRQSIDQPVRLVRGGRIVGLARAVDMSKTGVGIECRGAVFAAGECLEVDFFKLGNPRGVSYCFHAIVVHAGDNGVGMAFVVGDALDEAGGVEAEPA